MKAQKHTRYPLAVRVKTAAKQIPSAIRHTDGPFVARALFGASFCMGFQRQCLLYSEGRVCMANKPLHPCAYIGCQALTREKYCKRHQERPKELRASAYRRGYTSRWSKESRAFLALHPWCAECARHGKTVPAELVDHIRPHKGDIGLFWNRSNWQALCWSCHSSKTAREDGGFGNPLPHP
nr:MAG TPA: HNH endonuclease [Caudoviricetes sp.]